MLYKDWIDQTKQRPRRPNTFKSDLQIISWHGPDTNPTLNVPTKSLETSKLSRKLQIKSKIQTNIKLICEFGTIILIL